MMLMMLMLMLLMTTSKMITSRTEYVESTRWVGECDILDGSIDNLMLKLSRAGLSTSSPPGGLADHNSVDADDADDYKQNNHKQD